MPSQKTTERSDWNKAVAMRLSQIDLDLWGLEVDNGWWCDLNGVVFHTPYKDVAELQAAILRSRGALKVFVKMIPYGRH